MERIDPRRLGRGIRQGFYLSHPGTRGSLVDQGDCFGASCLTCERRKQVSMVNITYLQEHQDHVGRQEGVECGYDRDVQMLILGVRRISNRSEMRALRSLLLDTSTSWYAPVPVLSFTQ